MKPEPYYYKAQLTGWLGYTLIATLVYLLAENEIKLDFIGAIYLMFSLGLITSHLYRWAIIRLGWLEMDIFQLIPRIGLACIGLAVAFHSIYITIGDLVFMWGMVFHWTDTNLLAWLMLFFIWNLIYFAYVFFKRYRREEIKNLKLEAARNEYELRRLRDQMNPHFIFNAMNTIRALIDENPLKAKSAVTQLSNVLRSSLQTSKEDLITLDREMQIVRDYLEIEKVRYEERLTVEVDLEQGTSSLMIPPLMLQTLVENAIKHGIAKLPKGGLVKIQSKRTEEAVEICVCNSGHYNPSQESDSTLGLENTRNRLRLSFGQEAWMSIENFTENTVKTTIHLPHKI